MNPHQIPFKSKTKQNILDQNILDQTRPYIHLSHPSKSLEKVTILGLHLRRHGSAEVWKSWHEPTSGGLANAEVLHHLAEPRLCGGSAHLAGRARRGREVV
jgi:hypothetical protein